MNSNSKGTNVLTLTEIEITTPEAYVLNQVANYLVGKLPTKIGWKTKHFFQNSMSVTEIAARLNALIRKISADLHLHVEPSERADKILELRRKLCAFDPPRGLDYSWIAYANNLFCLIVEDAKAELEKQNTDLRHCEAQWPNLRKEEPNPEVPLEEVLKVALQAASQAASADHLQTLEGFMGTWSPLVSGFLFRSEPGHPELFAAALRALIDFYVCLKKPFPHHGYADAAHFLLTS